MDIITIRQSLGQVFAGIIILTVLSVGITFLRADDLQGLVTRLGTQLKYPYFSFTWCADFDELGLPISRIFPRGEILDCEELLPGAEVASAPGFLSRREYATDILVLNTIADYLPLCLSMLLSLITFRGLTRKVPRYLLELAQAGRLRPPREKKALTGNGKGEAKAKILSLSWVASSTITIVPPLSLLFLLLEFPNSLPPLHKKPSFVFLRVSLPI